MQLWLNPSWKFHCLVLVVMRNDRLSRFFHQDLSKLLKRTNYYAWSQCSHDLRFPWSLAFNSDLLTDSTLPKIYNGLCSQVSVLYFLDVCKSWHWTHFLLDSIFPWLTSDGCYLPCFHSDSPRPVFLCNSGRVGFPFPISWGDMHRSHLSSLCGLRHASYHHSLRPLNSSGCTLLELFVTFCSILIVIVGFPSA